MLTKETLDTMRCAHGDSCDCGVLFLHGACHLSAYLEVSYRKDDGCLHINCSKCRKSVAVIAVQSNAGLPRKRAMQ